MISGVAYITAEDIARRLAKKKPHWFHGLPSIRLNGEDGRFGTLEFDFGDEVVKIKVYIKKDSREVILDQAHIAIHNFAMILMKMGH